MKKIFFVLFVFIAAKSFSQFPVSQSLGSGKTQVFSKGAFGADTGIVYRHAFPDTITANLGFLKNVPGLVIKVVDDLWIRNSAANQWIQIGKSMTLTTIGATPNANAATISGGVLNLQPADQNFGGVLTATNQTIGGGKDFRTWLKVSFSGSVWWEHSVDNTGLYTIETNDVNNKAWFRTRQIDYGNIPANIGYSGSGYPGLAYNVNFSSSSGTYSYRIGGDPAYFIHMGGVGGDRIAMNYVPTGSGAITWNTGLYLKNTGKVGIPGLGTTGNRIVGRDANSELFDTGIDPATVSIGLTANNGVILNSNNLEWGGRFSSPRNISGGGNSWTMDSLNGVTFRARGLALFRFVATNSSTDSFYLEAQRGIGSTSHVGMGAANASLLSNINIIPGHITLQVVSNTANDFAFVDVVNGAGGPVVLNECFNNAGTISSSIKTFRDSIRIEPNNGDLRIDTLNSTIDTTNFKLMVWRFSTGEVKYLPYYIGAGGGGGEINTASNLGGGVNNYDSKSGVDLRFNTFNTNHFSLSSNLISLKTQMSITTDGSGLKLVGDVTTPNKNKYYGTRNSDGARNWLRSITYEIQDAGLTTDASTITLDSLLIEDGSAGKVTATFVMYEATGSGIVYTRAVSYRKISGTLTLGTVHTEGSDDIISSTGLIGAATLDAAGNNIRARGTGGSSHSVNWSVTIKWEKEVPGS